MDWYEFVRGPMTWAAFAVLIVASIIRIAILMGRARAIHRMHPGKSLRGGVKSIVRGLLPLGLRAMRAQPLFGLATFIFHVCVLITPLFLLAHIVLVYESWQIQWGSLPDAMADTLSFVALAGIAFFAVRRWRQREVRSVTELSDWALLAVIGGVFLTGILAYHHWGPYRPMLIAHVALGNLLLIMVPFSKMLHMALYFFTRGYLGAEYEIVMDGEGL